MKRLVFAASLMILGSSPALEAASTEPRRAASSTEPAEPTSRKPAPDGRAPSATARPNRGGKIVWRQDVEAALGDAARAGQRVLIYFTADW